MEVIKNAKYSPEMGISITEFYFRTYHTALYQSVLKREKLDTKIVNEMCKYLIEYGSTIKKFPVVKDLLIMAHIDPLVSDFYETEINFYLSDHLKK